MTDDLVYWIWLSCATLTSTRTASKLLEKFSHPYAIYRLSAEEIDSLKLPQKTAERLKDKSLNASEKILDTADFKKIGIITSADPDYPSSLLSLPDKPVVLYYKGIKSVLNGNAYLSVVGTRNPSEYAVCAGEKLCRELALAGITTVSGMALGCDAVAHAASVENDCPTIAVIGSGIDDLYPKENIPLAEKIIKNGIIISEYPPKTPPKREHFPMRNRIIAALGEALLVIESSAGGGSLITAKYAAKLSKKIYFLPGSILDERASGSNALAQDGGIAIYSGNDIIKEFSQNHKLEIRLPEKEVSPPISYAVKSPSVKKTDFSEYSLDECQTYIMERLTSDDLLPEKLICDGMNISKILANLTLLEMKGLVIALPGGKYSAKI